MDYLEIPLRTLSTKQDALLTYVEDFTTATFQLMTGHLQGRDRTVHIMKDIVERPKIKGPPSLINLQDTLKGVLFEYHQNTVSGTIHHNTHIKTIKTDKERRGVIGPDPNKTIPGNTPPTKWPVVLFTDQTVTKVQLELDNIMNTLEKHKKLVAEAATIGKKTNYHYEKSQAKYQQYVESNTKHFQDWQREGHINLKKMRKDLDHFGEKYFHYYDQYEKIKTKYYTIGDKHDHMINGLKGRLQELKQLIVREIVLSLQHGMRQLKKITETIIISKTLSEQLETIDLKTIANEIYQSLCSTYQFPDIARDIITEGKGQMLDQIWHNDTRVEKTDHGTFGLLDTTLVDTNLGDVYVKMITNYSKKTDGDLKLKIGQIVKVKLCSDDGKKSFGWTKNVFGVKKWGFFETGQCISKPLTTARISRESEPLIKGADSVD